MKNILPFQKYVLNLHRINEPNQPLLYCTYGAVRKYVKHM